MSAAQSRYIRTAITEVLHGATGTVRVVPQNMFESGAVAGQTVPAQQTKTRDSRFLHRFDVLVRKQSPNAATPLSVKASYRISDFDITISIWTKLKAVTLLDSKEEQRAQIEGDADVALQALNYPGNLTFTLDGRDTGIISGMLLGTEGLGTPVWETVEEDWKQLILRSQITAVAKVKITQPVAA